MAIQKFTVSRDDSVYQAFPDVVLTKGGNLICVFTQCKHHGDRELSHLVLCHSADRGRTWGPRERLTDFTTKTGYWNCARISRLADNRLMLLADFIKGDEEGESAIYYWTSDAEGTVWDGPFETPARGIVPDKLVEADGGRWIIACHKLSDKLNLREVALWYSDDKGETWSPKITIASHPRYKLCEASMLRIKNSRTLVCFLRENSGLGYDCFKAISDDNGETWRGVYHVPLPGCHRPVAGYLDNGMVMITYRFMQGGMGWLGNWTQNVFAAFLPAEQLTCEARERQSARIMPLDYDRSPVSDLGYTGWVQFEDGEIYVVNYIADDAPNPQIRGYGFSMTDVLLE